jgi:enoyl-CoA hydratase/carnithine racemase
VIVDNKPGPGTTIGSDVVAQSAPDGYTLLMATFAHAVNPSLRKKLPYDTAKAFAAVALIGKSNNALVVRTESPFQTLQDIVEAAKVKPGKLTFVSQGAGTPPAVVARLNEAANKVISTAFFQTRVKEDGPRVTPWAPDVLDRYVVDETAKWKTIVAENKIELQQNTAFCNFRVTGRPKMTDELVQVSALSGVATVVLNRPDKRNAMSDAMRSQFVAVMERLGTDPAVRAVVLTGAGKGFCAGGDVAGMEKRLSAPQGEVGFNGWLRQQGVHRAQGLLYSMPKPTIAAVNGAAAGLGADVALACDFVMASDAASFTWSYIHRGLIPDGGGMYFLPRRVGLSRAKELIFSGRKVEAEEALRLGIADRMSAPDTLLSEAQKWAEELSAGSATALALGKSILNQSLEMSAEQVFARGSQAQGICYTSTQHRDSVAAFLARAGKR